MSGFGGSYERMMERARAEAGIPSSQPEAATTPQQTRDAIHRAKALQVIDALMAPEEFEREDKEYAEALGWAKAYNLAAIDGDGDSFIAQHKAALRAALASAGIFQFEPKTEPLTGDALESAGQRIFRDDIRHDR